MANRVARMFPPDYDTYYEPFVGGGSVLYAANPDTGVAGDRCVPLIDLWRYIRDDPNEVIEYYRKAWQRLQDEGESAYYDIRDEFNETRDPLQLLFLTRTCVNGLIRFNSEGEFNASLHLSRPGVQPSALARTVTRWSRRLSGVEFNADDYTTTLATATQKDIVFLDPPYFNSETLYYGDFDSDRFLDQLKQLCDDGVRYALTLDGSAGEYDYSVDLPDWAYTEKHYLDTGTSPYQKVVSGESSQVTQTLYLNYRPESAQTTLDSYS